MESVLKTFKYNNIKLGFLSVVLSLLTIAAFFLCATASEWLTKDRFTYIFTNYSAHIPTVYIALDAIAHLIFSILLVLMYVIYFVLFSSRSRNILVVKDGVIYIPSGLYATKAIIPLQCVTCITDGDNILIDYHCNGVSRQASLNKSLLQNGSELFEVLNNEWSKAKNIKKEVYDLYLKDDDLSPMDRNNLHTLVDTFYNLEPTSGKRRLHYGLTKEQAAHELKIARSKDFPITIRKRVIDKNTEIPTINPKDQKLYFPTFLAYSLFIIPGGATLWVIVLYLSLYQLDIKPKFNFLIILLLLFFEAFISSIGVEYNGWSVSLLIFGCLSYASFLFGEDFEEKYNVTPNKLMTVILPVLYITHFVANFICSDRDD